MKIQKRWFMAALMLGSLVACANFAAAQDSNAPRRGQGQGRGQGQNVQQRVDRMATELKLTDDQKTKVTALFEEDAKKMRELRDNKDLSQEDRREKLRALRTENDKKLKAILTPEQHEKWAKMREEMRQRRPGGPGGQGDSAAPSPEKKSDTK